MACQRRRRGGGGDGDDGITKTVAAVVSLGYINTTISPPTYLRSAAAAAEE